MTNNITIRLADERDIRPTYEELCEVVQYYSKLKNSPDFFHQEVTKEVQTDGNWSKAYERVEKKLEDMGLGRHYSEYQGYRVQKCRIQNAKQSIQMALFER